MLILSFENWLPGPSFWNPSQKKNLSGDPKLLNEVSKEHVDDQIFIIHVLEDWSTNENDKNKSFNCMWIRKATKKLFSSPNFYILQL